MITLEDNILKFGYIFYIIGRIDLWIKFPDEDPYFDTPEEILEWINNEELKFCDDYKSEIINLLNKKEQNGKADS